MQEPEPYMSVPGHASDANVSTGRKQESDTSVEAAVSVELDNAGYLRGWRLHLVSLRFV